MNKFINMCFLSVIITSILSACEKYDTHPHNEIENTTEVNSNVRLENTPQLGGSNGQENLTVSKVNVSISTSSIVTLDTSDDNHDSPTTLWALTTKPKESSATLENTTSVNPTFTADVDGVYRVQKIAKNGTVESMNRTVTFIATTLETVENKSVFYKLNTSPLSNAENYYTDNDTDNDGISDDLDMNDDVIAHPSNLGASYVIDERLKFILYNGDDIDLNTNNIVGLESVVIDTEDSMLMKGKEYNVTYNGSHFKFYRTELPIIYLNTGNQTILDDPKIPADLIILENGKKRFESFMGIEMRGFSSQFFPKKSYSIELWKDPTGNNKDKKSLLNLRTDDEWILDGLWNEPLRLRDSVSHSLWLKVGRYPYSKKKPNITVGIEKKYAELFLNGEYRGIYYLGEKVDHEQLEIKKYDDGLTGELYKAKHEQLGSEFIGVENYTNYSSLWSGYEAKYPKDVAVIDWSNLHALVDFVVNSDKKTFDATISEKVDFENMADYYIFINMLYATDNMHKNFFVARYNQNSPYFFIPWDMDGSFGRDWRGDITNITTQMLSSNLFDRLLLNDKFKREVKIRWNTLKSDELSVSELQNMFKKNNEYLLSNGAYAREELDLQSELPYFIYEETEIDFINEWIERRFTYMDSYFNEL